MATETKDLKDMDKSHIDPGKYLKVFEYSANVWMYLIFAETTDSDSASHHSIVKDERSKYSLKLW